MIDSVAVPRAAGVPRGNAKLVESLCNPLLAPAGLQPLEDPDPRLDPLLIVRHEADMAVPLRMTVVHGDLNERAVRLPEKAAVTVQWTIARAIALTRKFDVLGDDAFRKLSAELTALVIANE